MIYEYAALALTGLTFFCLGWSLRAALARADARHHDAFAGALIEGLQKTIREKEIVELEYPSAEYGRMLNLETPIAPWSK